MEVKPPPKMFCILNIPQTMDCPTQSQCIESTTITHIQRIV